MGQAAGPIAFHADAESPAGGGLRSVVSEPVEALTPDEFWALLAADLRSRHWAPQDAGRGAPRDGLLALQAGRLYEWLLHPDLDQAECYCYGADSSLSAPVSRGTLQVHREPFVLEFWSLVYGEDDCGDALKGNLRKFLVSMRSKAECFLDCDSPGGHGHKCVLSAPITDCVLSPDMLWKQTKEGIRRNALKVLSDGSVVQKLATGWDLFGSKESYSKRVFDDATMEIASYIYGDEALSPGSLETIRHFRVHARPFRLEMRMATADQRRAGDAERFELMELLEPVLEQAQLMSAQPTHEASTAQISGLQQEINALRKEVSHALGTLHEGAGALDSW